VRVLLLSGKRGGYGAMKKLISMLDSDERFELLIVLTDQHTSQLFGNTSAEVDIDFPLNTKLSMGEVGSSPDDRCRGLSIFMSKFSGAVEEFAPDLCIIYGDRSEVVVAGLVCNLHEIPIVHIQGGDVSGSADDNFRHAISKMSHIHFPSTELSKKRLLMLGEDSKNIHVVGDCHLDHVLSSQRKQRDYIFKHLPLDEKKKVIVVLQHSETTESFKSFDQMKETLKALQAFDNFNIVAIYPCSDPGYQGILDAYDSFKDHLDFRIYPNLDSDVFSGLLAVSDVLVGNSSCGIIESAAFGVPTVNIGRRQAGRLAPSNVLNVSHIADDIRAAIHKCIYDAAFIENCKQVKNPYGDGKACEGIYNVLCAMTPSKTILQKEFSWYA
jgi:GDP/UDP-N,N'-diacetylbacillosamine 2-epimerase (hydrolysing)